MKAALRASAAALGECRPRNDPLPPGRDAFTARRRGGRPARGYDSPTCGTCIRGDGRRAPSRCFERGDVWGNVWGDDGRQAVASVRVEKRRLEGCAFLPCGVSLPRGQRKGGNPFKALRHGLAASVPTEKKQFAHTLIRLLSMTCRAARVPPHAEGKPCFCRSPPGSLKKSSCAVPGCFAQDASSERSEKSPLPCAPSAALRCRVVPRWREEICVRPRASWSSFAGACRSSGVFARRPITSTQAGRAQSRTPSRQRIALARAGRASGQDAGPFMVRGPATGRNAFSGTA